MNTGIYSIEHVASGKVYIGSAANFAARWRTHKSLLRKGTHHSRHLQLAWNKYGQTAFEFKKLLICAKKNLILYEQILMDGFKAAERNFGYNGRPTASSMLGLKHSPESKAKMSAANLGRKASPETRALLSSQRTGRKMPDWFPEFTRSHRIGFKHSEKTKAYIGSIQKGVFRSKEWAERQGKLTSDQALEIHARYAAGGITQSALAKEFSLNQATVSHIVTGKSWSKFLSVSKENLS